MKLMMKCAHGLCSLWPLVYSKVTDKIELVSTFCVGSHKATTLHLQC